MSSILVRDMSTKVPFITYRLDHGKTPHYRVIVRGHDI